MSIDHILFKQHSDNPDTEKAYAVQTQT